MQNLGLIVFKAATSLIRCNANFKRMLRLVFAIILTSCVAYDGFGQSQLPIEQTMSESQMKNPGIRSSADEVRMLRETMSKLGLKHPLLQRTRNELRAAESKLRDRLAEFEKEDTPKVGPSTSGLPIAPMESESTVVSLPVRRKAWSRYEPWGTPDPPLPYSVEKAYAGLAWERPIYLKQEPKTNNLVVAEAEGRIVLIEASGDGDDSGLNEKRELAYFRDRIIYGFEFHPDYGRNGWVYLFSNSGRGVPNAKNRISRISVTRENGNAVAWATDSEVLLLEWTSTGHDGGDLLFGKDGKLYISTGDGSSDSDDWMSAQDVTNLLGSILRIDVDRPSENLQYSIPADNPFVDLPNARGELWAIGLRNPWRMSMDQKTGDVWIGNNGQDLWESVHILGRGFNYGWSVYEGSHPFYTNRPLGPGILTTPTIEHHHREARSLTGGVVYRGKQYPELNGAYVYGDHETGKIWAAKYDGKSIEWRREIASTTLKIVCFANDSQGELLIVDYNSGIYRLASNKGPKNSRAKTRFPRRLSETGLYESVSNRKTADGVVPYSINARAWHDGAQSERFFALPENGQIEYRSYRSWRFPEGAILGQTLYLPVDIGSQRREKVLETRLLVKQQGDELYLHVE